MKKIVIHIGAHKTGSSYLQEQFADNYEVLKNNGILYPKKWRNILYGHHQFIPELMNKYKSQQYINELKIYFEQELKEYDCIMLSSENFEYLNEEQIQSLSVLTEIANVEIVYYIRKWSSLSFSVWQETIKEDNYETFESFLSKEYLYPFRSNILNYSRIVDKFLINMNNIKFSVIAYDNLLSKKIDIVEHFFKTILNVNITLRKELKVKTNVSLQPLDIEIIRALNYLGSINGIVSSYKISNAYFQMKEKRFNDIEYFNTRVNNHTSIVSVDDSGFVPISVYREFYSHYGDLIINPSDNGLIFYEIEKKDHKIISHNMWLDINNTKILNKIYNKISLGKYR